MKKILLLIFLILSASTHSQSLTGTLIEKHIKAVGDKMLEDRELTPIFFSYIYSQNKSIQKLISEDISSVQYKLEEHSSRIAMIEDEYIMPYSRTYYKDFKENVYQLNSKTKNSELAIKDKITQYNWTFINETKILNGYKCLKAITNGTRFSFKQPITAWYTKEIQINDGPLDYTGLPGFIMQVEIGNLTLFTFEKLNLTSENTQIIEPEPSVKEITFEEYNNSTSR